jgi:N utilization substance protein B
VTDIEAVAGDLASVARGEADPASVFVGTEPLPLREAAEMIESATADPVGFAARHGDAARDALHVGPEGLARLRRLLRRDDALAVLYGAEQRGGPPSVEGLGDEAVALAMGTWEDRADLDRAIGEAAVGWTVARMPPVDRSILRLALYELLRHPETPSAVVVSEAVRLAKAYSTQESGRFVNGVLGELVRRLG